MMPLMNLQVFMRDHILKTTKMRHFTMSNATALMLFTDKPARFKAGWIYEKHLKNYKEAEINYRKALQISIDEADRYKARTRLMQLQKEGY